ncbi:hypothetical protein PHLGIDRAFT_468557 [Phlebiopsis gigantea 11061_1 CR5-6]|uniref:YEATS domain-containing protein n=1 Tax=Phlebiopsis gigantea (strain 11061_1 CR5-6) TaxID=745531 RepID=A0A0C3NME7_PHLG1|nr:hypothetical protein PHLGIDRAFT_468557 [Phlebiopsis gigantea 11061_1 CR5-6]
MPVQAPATAPPQIRQADTPAAVPQSTYSTRNRGQGRAARSLPRKLLFLRNTTTSPPQIAKLACPDCSRTDFSSLQGLLNHCRLSHKREFGSHDECVQCCAVLVEGAEDQTRVIANGTEVGGITIPGLRRLFEIAVGGTTQAAMLLPHKKPEPPPGAEASLPSQVAPAPGPLSSSAREDPAPVTRTLGYHADTPALASFLGRAPKQRRIHSYDENKPVDIFGDEGGSKGSHWRMSYTHRNKARAALDVVVEPSAAASGSAVEPTPQLSTIAASLLHGTVSRFHMMARINIRDLSMWLPVSRRVKSRDDHTHRWRLEVSAPSYSLPLNAFVTKMTVCSVTHPPPSTLIQPIIVDKPPFVATSTTNKPFLARITFTFAGDENLNPPLDVEHWVELDPLHLSHAVPGDEQVFDITLDRATELLRAGHEEPRSISWNDDSVDRDANVRGADEVSTERPDDADEEPDYSVRLRTLLPQFPLTVKDLKAGQPPRHIPYTLVATPAQFRNLVYGRQKAIEWERAHALCAAYEEACRSEPWPDGRADIALTTGDVFRWLEEEGQFLRKSRRPVIQSVQTSKAKRTVVKHEPEERPDEEYCRNCGLHYLQHPTGPLEPLQEVYGTRSDLDNIKQEPVAPVNPSLSPLVLSCSSFNIASALDFPVLDVNRLLASPPYAGPGAAAAMAYGLNPVLFAPQPSSHEENYSTRTTTARELVTAAEPDIVRATEALVTRWKLDRATGTNGDRLDLEDRVAPSAMLALAVRCFTRMLMKSALGEFARDEAGLRPRGAAAKGRLLTPAHVVRGLLHDAPTVGGCGAVLLATASLGMALPAVKPGAGDETTAIGR